MAENRRAVQISLLAEIAILYVSERATAQRLRLVQDTLAPQRDTLQLARWHALAGLASDVEVEQATHRAAQTTAVLPDLTEARAAASLNRIEALRHE